MYATDFEYDGLRLSDFGFTIGDIDGSSGIDVVSAGSKITFNTVKRHYGKIYGLPSTSFDECITATFQIIKNPCTNDDMKITAEEFRSLARWLNRHEFLQFHLIPDEGDTRAVTYYDASFNLGKIMSDDEICGIELEMETNRPYGYGETVTTTFTSTSPGSTYQVTDLSDDIGYSFPSMVITLKASGDLTITNSTTGSTMTIKNCSSGEVITVDGDAMIVTSSLSAHKLYNDFNFEFIKIANTYANRVNNFTFTPSCDATITYKPVIKNSPE